MMEHVTMNTSNLEASIHFYEKYIGLKIVGDMRSHGTPIVFMASDEKDETKLEIIQSDRPFQGSGIFIGFKMADFEERLAFFKEEGLQVTDIISPNPHVHFFFVTDPNGLQVQIMA